MHLWRSVVSLRSPTRTYPARFASLAASTRFARRPAPGLAVCFRPHSMSYSVTGVFGDAERGFSTNRFEELIEQVERLSDQEHTNASVTHESEWSLAVFRNGKVVLENLEEGEPLHMESLSRERVLELMVAVAEGRIDEVRALPGWKAGYVWSS